MVRTSYYLMLIAACLLLSPTFSGVEIAVAQSSLKQCPKGDGVWDNCFGKWSDGKGYSYEGEWQDNKQNGQGTYTYTDSGTYVGEFKDNNKHGQGTYYTDGGTYVGEFKDDTYNGQ